MRSEVQLDYAVFQLNPTRTRCELHISAQGMTYKLAAGLLQPFLAHLRAAEEQVARGGYSIHLEPPDPGCAGWFTKGTMERFVRFVSTPEVLEQVSNIEMELLEIEKTLRLQSRDASENTQHAEELLSKLAHLVNFTGGMPLASEHVEKPAKGAKMDMEETTKQRLSRALESRRMMLEEELGMALARSIAAGFTAEHIRDLIAFAETFGAKRLWGACSNFIALCKTRQQTGVSQDDLKLSVAEAQADMAFNGNVVHRMGFREDLDLQCRGSRQDDLRRASLPSQGSPALNDGGLEKLTRQGSLDELTEEFLQVAACMRSSGMMEGADVDWSNNKHYPIGGGNRPVSGEMQVGVAHLGGNRDPESVLQLPRGHQIMAAWRGQPQNHPMDNVHPLMRGSMHPSIPTPFGIPGLPVPGYCYPPNPGNPYMGHAYKEANDWQFPSSLSPPFWQHPMCNNTGAPTASDRGEFALPMFEKHETNHNHFSNNELHEEITLPVQRSSSDLPNVNGLRGSPSSTQRSTNYQPVVNELHGETSRSTQRPASELPVVNELHGSTEHPTSELYEETSGSSQRSASDLPISEYIQPTLITPPKLPIKNDRDEDSTSHVFPEGDCESFAERTRRLPIRSSSPSRRSASPLKKVQIGRSGSRRPTRNVNHVAQAIQEKIENGNNDKESSESWSEDNDDSKNDEETKELPVRARVQDVIGLFERKKDVGDIKSKPLTKEVGRIQSNNSVLKRWTESAAVRKDASTIDDSTATEQIRKGGSTASTYDVAERKSNEPNMTERKEERTRLVQEENAELEAASNVESLQASDEQPAVKLSTLTRNNFSNLELEMPNHPKSDGGIWKSSESDVLLVSEDSVGKSYTMLMQDDAHTLGTDTVDDIQSGQEKNDVNVSLNDGLGNEDVDAGVNPEAAYLKKVSVRDAKAKAMQELLERRKAASGNRTGKPNPLAEAQVRAEKLRAYKAGLQKSKLEKDEVEKKRIEDLRSQRKERMTARGSPQGGCFAQSPTTKQPPQSPTTKQPPQTPPPAGIIRASPTVTSHKLSSFSPRNSIDVPASSSPNFSSVKGAAGNKLPRTPTGTPRAKENASSLSVLSLSELKKESPKAALAVRSSTGSQHLSQLKKNLKDVDPNNSPKANGHSEEKRRSLPLATGRKGIPPAKDSKNEGLPVVKKSSKGSMVANKQHKKPGNSATSVKSKETAREAVEVTSSTEQVDAANVEAVDETGAGNDKQERADEREAGNEKQEIGADIAEASLDNDCFSLEDARTVEDDEGYEQIRAPPCNEAETLGSVDDSSCLVDGELPTPSESLVTEDLKETVTLQSHTALLSFVEGEVDGEADGDKGAEDSYCAPVAHVSPMDENPTTLKDLDASREELNAPFIDDLPSNSNVSTDKLPNSPPAEAYNPPRALPSDSPLCIPKNLPRLHEAIQEAQSPELIMPGINRPRKTLDDESGSLRSSKEHAKGFKRLLLMGRKSSRNASQNAADWVSVSMASEVGDDEQANFSNTAKKMGSGEAKAKTNSVAHRAEKPGVQSYSGNSSSRGSRSFFSLSTFRGKIEGK